MVEINERYADAGGYRIHYLQAGESGPPLVLLHGGIIDAAHVSWGELIEPLAEHYRVFVPDLLGYGESDRPDIAYSTNRHVAVVDSFMSRAGIDEAAVCGVSMGGGIAIGLALRRPERVSQLVPVSSYGLGRELPNGTLTYLLSRTTLPNRLAIALFAESERATRTSLETLVADPTSVSSKLVAQVQALAGTPNVGRAYRRWRRAEVGQAGFRTDYRPRLGELDAPTLFVHGRGDEVFPAEWSARAADLAGGDSWLIGNCGHLVPREYPTAFAERLVEFLD